MRKQTVNALESGKYDPSLPLAFTIARLFGQPIEALFIPDLPPVAETPAPAAAAAERR